MVVNSHWQARGVNNPPMPGIMAMVYCTKQDGSGTYDHIVAWCYSMSEAEYIVRIHEQDLEARGMK